MDLGEESSDLLGANGPFVDSIAGFQPRQSQMEMAAAVERCLQDDGLLIAESGTGTGKTFAYLVPALCSGKKVIVSTGTKPLQDQLYHRDLPAVLGAMQTTARTALLKGRANYLCLYRLEAAGQQLDFLSRQRVTELNHVQQWAAGTTNGDLNELSAIADDSPVRPMVSSTTDNCLGTKCQYYDNCYVNKARKAALGAELLVINHHLFCADLVLKEDGFGQLLPGADAVIFDEAHQLAEVATNFLGVSQSSNQLRELCRDVDAEEMREQSQVVGLKDSAAEVNSRLDGLLALIDPRKDRVGWNSLSTQPAFCDALSLLTEAVSELSDGLELAAPAGEGLTRCWGRALGAADNLSRFSESAKSSVVRWAETGKRWFRFHETPLHLGESLQPYLGDQGRAWIYTSATLSVNGDFSYFSNQLGIEPTEAISLESSFDFQKQARLFIPTALPDPRQPQYVREMVEKVLPVIDLAGGRTFFLFTSYAALHEARDLLREKTDYLLLVQGEIPRTELLDQFRNNPGTVLLGTTSFWEGVDVKGQALSCVVIDKLPFESPSDPLLKARLEAIESEGGNPFVDYQLPHAVIALKQGAGRLIRDQDDFGVLVLCDPRLMDKSYGRVFLRSLPKFPLTRDVHDVEAFFEAMPGGAC